MGFNGLYGQDSHAYYQYSLKIKEMLQGSEDELGYFFWPKLYPFFGALIGLTGVPVLFSLKLISLLSFIGILTYINKLIQLYHKKNGILFILIAAATQIYFLRGGFLVMSDMLAAFFCIFAFYQYSLYAQQGLFRNVVLFFVAAILAFFTRYPTGVLLFIPAVAMSYLIFKKSSVLIRLIIVLGSVGLIWFLMVFNSNFLNSLNHLIGTWSPSHIFSRNFKTPDGVSEHLVPNGMYAFGNFFHFGYLSFGSLLIPFYKKLKNAKPVLVTSIIFYLLFLAGHETQNYRFLLIVHPFVLLLLFHAHSSLKSWLKERRLFFLFIIGVLLFNVGFAWYSFRKIYKVHAIEVEITQRVKNENYEGLIYSFYVDQSFKSYGLDNEVKNFFYEDYTHFEKGALVIFNKDQFENQWAEHRVMQNWIRLKKNYHLDTVSLHTNNWIIYRIK
ncbi:MAG: hypothetical protein COA32_00660 [Fluviicola sp.]|nr:MAG: hypothetical protein COA32_00660 [Fluviicola sp.]